MRPTTSFRYGLPTPTEVAGRTGKEILQGIIDGRLPHAPISQTMRLGANSNRQRRRLRRAFPAAGRLGLHHDRDQGQFCAADHQGHRARSRGSARRVAGQTGDLE